MEHKADDFLCHHSKDDITKVTAPDLTIDYSSIPDGIDSSFGIFKKLAPNLVFFLKHLEGAIEATSSSP